MRALALFVTMLVFCFDLSNARVNGRAAILHRANGVDISMHRTDSQIVMDSVSLADRPNFVAFHLSIALNERRRDDVVFKPFLETIPPEKRAEFSIISTPPNFSTNLLDWTELELVPFQNGAQANHNTLAEMLGLRVTAHAADAGYLCCPF